MIILNKGTRLYKKREGNYVWDSRVSYERHIIPIEEELYLESWNLDWKTGRMFKINKDADGRSYDRLANFTYKRTIND